MINSDFNKKALIAELEKVKGWKISYIAFWKWETKGYIKPSSYIQDGQRMVPIYYRADLPIIIATLEQLDKIGKIRLKGGD